MKRVVLGLFAIAIITVSAAPAVAYGYGHYAHYGPRHGHWGPGCYPSPRVHYRPFAVPVPVAPVYPAYPPYPPAQQGFSYFSPGFSFSFSR
jgi:hypothetical protein